MQVRMRYFAALREIVGRDAETLDVLDGANVAAIRALLQERSPGLERVLPRCAVAVNRAYVEPETPLHDGDELAFIPPLGGG